jgi:hypothetical protein
LEFVWLVYNSAGFTEFESGFRLLAESGYTIDLGFFDYVKEGKFLLKIISKDFFPNDVIHSFLFLCKGFLNLGDQPFKDS